MMLADLIAELNRDSALTSAHLKVFGEVPAERPERFITVERTGGGRDGLLDNAQLAVQVWAGSTYDALRLAELVAGVLTRLPARLPWLAAVTVNSIANFPDTSGTKLRHRAQIFAYTTTHLNGD